MRHPLASISSTAAPTSASVNERAALDYLAQHQTKDLLRFTVVGSVDDGKSTLIGRLLHDSGQVYEDQLHAVRKATAKKGEEEIDFSLFTDGLKAEREQGITIDVAYRYFTTNKRKFIIADTPGHVQYTRNMATGASTAKLAIILLDARLGVLPQSRRHAYIARLLGIPRLVACVNKMDLVDYSESTFTQLRRDFDAFARTLGFEEIVYIPVSAKQGDNIVSRSARLPFYTGPTLLEYLEDVPLEDHASNTAMRFPVQYVLRPHLNYRGFAGTLASGRVYPGDTVMVLPSRRTTRVTHVDVGEKSLPSAQSPMSISLRLADEIDISRGDMLVPPTALTNVVSSFCATLVWLGKKSLDRGKSYLLKQTTQTVRAEVDQIEYVVDLETLKRHASETLELNDIGAVTIQTRRPIYVDTYEENRATGAFILIDSVTNDTVAAGMISAVAQSSRPSSCRAEAGHGSWVSARERRERLGQSGALISIPNTASSIELGRALERGLFDASRIAVLLDLSTPPYQAESALREIVSKLLDVGLFVIVCHGTAQQAAALQHGLDGRILIDLSLPGDAPDPEDLARNLLKIIEERKLVD